MHQHAHKTGNGYTTSPVKIRFVEGTREWIERDSSSREDEKQREEVVRRGEGTEMAEGLNSITKVRGFPKLLFSSFNLLLLDPCRCFVSRKHIVSSPSLSAPIVLHSPSRAFTETSRFFNMQHATRWDNTRRGKRLSWNELLESISERRTGRGEGRRMENERNNGVGKGKKGRWQPHAFWDNVFPVDSQS